MSLYKGFPCEISIFNRFENPKYRKIKKFYTMNIFCLLSNYCFLVVLGDGIQFEILHFQMNFFSIPRILTAVRVPAILKKLNEIWKFQNWGFGLGLALKVSFDKYLKKDPHDLFRKTPYSASKPANYPQPGMLRMVDLSRNPGFGTPLGRGNIMDAPIWRG